MQNILKKVFKNLKKASCLALSLLLIFVSVPMVFAEDDFTTYEEQQELLAAVQEFIIKAVTLSPEERNALVNILKDIDEENKTIEDAALDVAEIFEVDLEDDEKVGKIEKALEKYDGFGDTIKGRTKDFIDKVEYPDSLEGYQGFESIAEIINEDVTGDPEDDSGIKFVIASLTYIAKHTSLGAVIFHDYENPDLIQLKVDISAAIKGEIVDLLDSTEILKDKIDEKEGDNSFEKLLSYLQDTVNESDVEEISELKEFLKEETEVFGENKLNVNVPSAPVKAGKKVPVTISLNSVDRIAGLNFIIKYDSDVFEVKQGDINVDKKNIEDNIEQDDISEEIKEGDYIVFDYGEGSFDELVDNTNGRVPFSFITIYSLLNNEDIDLITINFSVKSTATPGDYSIDIIEIDACNDAEDPEDVFVHVNAGTIKVIADKEDLAYAIQYAESLDGRDYTSATWKNLIDALNAARAVYNDENATQAQVDNALAVLEAAIDNLKPVGGTTPPPYTPRRTSSRTSRGVYGYPAPELPDVPSNHWAKPYIDAMADERIIEGRDDGLFYPEDPVTRAEFAKLITVALGLDNINARANFTDVGTHEWHYMYVASAANHGIIMGYPDGSFNPNAKITREDMAVIIARAMGYKDGSYASPVHFVDTDQIAEYATGHVGYCVERGFITGRPGNIMDPKGITTRAEAAVVIYRLLYY